jgi:hypothetical protein
LLPASNYVVQVTPSQPCFATAIRCCGDCVIVHPTPQRSLGHGGTSPTLGPFVTAKSRSTRSVSGAIAGIFVRAGELHPDLGHFEQQCLAGRIKGFLRQTQALPCTFPVLSAVNFEGDSNRPGPPDAFASWQNALAADWFQKMTRPRPKLVRPRPDAQTAPTQEGSRPPQTVGFIETSEAPSAIRTDLGAIFVSLELSRSRWLITSLHK